MRHNRGPLAGAWGYGVDSRRTVGRTGELRVLTTVVVGLAAPAARSVHDPVACLIARGAGLGKSLLWATPRSAPDRPARLPAHLDHAAADRLRHLYVDALGPADLHRLVRERTGLALARYDVRRLHAASGGNPLFALETARTLTRTG